MNLTSMLSVLPTKYAKFLTSLVGALVLYVQLYGFVWKPVPAVYFIAASLGVMAVPNKAAAPAPPVPAPAPPPAPPAANM